MARLGYCIPCGEGRSDVDATVMVGDDPMCAMHALEHGDGMLTKLPPEERTVTLVMTKLPEPVPLTEAIAAVAEAQAEPVASPLCSRGCGVRSHRGRCRGVAQPKPLATLRKYRKDEVVANVAADAGPVDAPVAELGEGSLKTSLAFVRAQYDELDKEENLALAELGTARQRFESAHAKRMRLIPLIDALVAHVEAR